MTAAFEYDTPKIVHIQNKKVGVLYRLFQLGIVGFMIGSVRLPFVIFCYFMYAIPLCVCVVCVCVRVCVCACVCVCVCVSSKQVQYHILEGLPEYAVGDRSGHHQAERGAVLQRYGWSAFFAKLRRD